MAKQEKKQTARTTIDELNQKLSNAEMRVESNKKIILWVIVAILAVIGIGLWAYYGVYQSNLSESKEAIGKADVAAMNGDTTALKLFQQVPNSNKYANRAALEAARILYSEGKYAEALKSLDDYSAEESCVGGVGTTMKGDCNVNLKKYDDAIACYDKAVKVADGNEYLIPYALIKKAEVLSAQGKHKEAADIYDQIRTKYTKFTGSNRIDVDKLYESETFRANNK